MLAVLDYSAILVSFGIALSFHADLVRILGEGLIPPRGLQLLFLIFYSAVTLLIFQYYNLYRIDIALSVVEQVARILQAVVYSVIGLAICSFFLKSNIVIDSRLVILYYSIAAFGLIVILRVAVFRPLYLWATRNALITVPMLIVGAGRTARQLAAHIAVENPYGFKIIGFADDLLPRGAHVFQDKHVVGKIRDIPDLVRAHGVKEILVSIDGVSHQDLLEVLDICYEATSRVKLASPLYGIVSEKMFTERFGDIPVIDVIHGEEDLGRKIVKRLVDVTLTTAGLLLLFPLFAAIAIAIRLDSPGPIIYSQVRNGKNGRPFKFYKFRSMLVGSDADHERRQKAVGFIKGDSEGAESKGKKIVNESRVTRVGRFIRRTSLDELPQLFNVLKGDMSLVGPRPCLPYEWEHYDAWHRRRLSVTPGCTGVWQVSGRNEVSFEDMVVLDLYYIQNWSPLLDFQILLKTIPVMALGKGGG